MKRLFCLICIILLVSLISGMEKNTTSQSMNNPKYNKLTQKEENIIITGNTVIDALDASIKRLDSYENEEIKKLKQIHNTDKKLLI